MRILLLNIPDNVKISLKDPSHKLKNSGVYQQITKIKIIMNENNNEKIESVNTKRNNITRNSSESPDGDNENNETVNEEEEDPLEGLVGIKEKLVYIRQLTQTEGCFESPIDITLTKAREIQLDPIEWVHFNEPAKKIKLTNTGLSVILSAKWSRERPFIQGGPFFGKYVFSNIHLHWGKDPMEGSEHSIDGVKYPLEMHVVIFKSSYLTQEAALKEQDGCTVLVYIFKLQDAPNREFQPIIDALDKIRHAETSTKIDPQPITNFMKIFRKDYLMYWGAISTQHCTHYILWLVTRIPIGLSAEQVDAFRSLFNKEGKLLTRNFRDLQGFHNRSLFHVCPSASKYSTLLPID